MFEGVKKMAKPKSRGNGQGTFYKIYYKDKDGNNTDRVKYYVGQVTVGKNEKGKPIKTTIYSKTSKECQLKVNEILMQLNNKTFVQKNDINIISILQNIAEHDLTANRIKETTYLRRLEDIKIIQKMKIANMNIQDITIKDINKDLLTIVNYSNSTIAKVYQTISSAFNYALLNKIVNENPFLIKGAIQKPKSNKENKKVEAFTVEEQKLFLKELEKDYKYKDIFYIALYTGMRIGEILALRKSDIDLENNTISITKTLSKDRNDKVILGKSTKTYSGNRTIPFLNILRPTLEKLQHDKEDFLFLNNNKFIVPSTINSHLKRICKNAGIRETIYTFERKGKNINLKISNVNTHMLRHTYATRCIEGGMQAVVLQKLLGHKDIQVTLNAYTSVFNRFKEEELQKVEKYFQNIM